jgi:hypothetical protein
MTEAEWLALEDVLLLYQDGRSVSLSRRSAILFGVACIRATPGIAEQHFLRVAVTEAEKAAGSGGWDKLTSIHRDAEAACRKAEQWSSRTSGATTKTSSTTAEVMGRTHGVAGCSI